MFTLFFSTVVWISGTIILRHNSDVTRLDTVDEKARNRLEKYKAAIELLEA